MSANHFFLKKNSTNEIIFFLNLPHKGVPKVRLSGPTRDTITSGAKVCDCVPVRDCNISYHEFFENIIQVTCESNQIQHTEYHY